MWDLSSQPEPEPMLLHWKCRVLDKSQPLTAFDESMSEDALMKFPTVRYQALTQF